MKKNIIFAALFLTGILAAETIDLTQPVHFSPAKNITAGENGLLTLKGPVATYSTKVFDLDPGKKYTISGDFRQTAGSKPTVLFFGVAPLDKKNRPILTPQTQIIRGTDTVLTADVAFGAKEIRVKDAEKWLKGYRFAINTDPSYKDLPNFSVIHTTMVSKVKEGDDWKVTFALPIKIALKKGTPVRQHSLGGAMYAAAPSVRIGKDWKTWKGTATGLMTTPGYSYNKFPIGTVKVCLVLYVNLGQKDAVTEVKNLKFIVE